MLVKFLKDKGGRRVGCLVGTERGIGWSTVHARKDTFSREKAISIALGRSERGYHIEATGSTGIATAQVGSNTERVATIVVKALPAFTARCNSYFKARG